MVHTDEKEATFHYFASTLRELNSDIQNVLFIGSHRQHSIENGLGPQMPIAQFLACKKHVEDNVKMKLATLGVPNKCDVLIDIFGDSTSRGLVDCETNGDFDSRLLQLKSFWESVSHGKEFYSYFVTHVAEEMKSKMLLPVRRAAGLGDNFFFNNSTESINSSLKSEVEKRKNAASPGRPSKCSYGELVNIANGFVTRYQRNFHRAIVSDGPYVLASRYQYLEVTEDAWREMSMKERCAKISVIDPVGSKKLPQSANATSTSVQEVCITSPVLSAADTGLTAQENVQTLK